VPRLTGGHEDNFVQVKGIRHFTCGDEVAIVDWVEGSAHYPNAWPLIGHESLVVCLLRGGLVVVTVRNVSV
jgi:hypothetical protein